MMASNEEAIQEDILAALDDGVAQPIYEQGIPDSKTVPVDSAGRIKPYVAIQFGDIGETGELSFAGVRSGDYALPVYTQAVAGTPKAARQISNRIKDAILGLEFDWTGQVSKRAGGGVFNTTASNGATEAYVAASSFTVTIQYE